MSRRKSIPVALTVAGSDSGGGAGIQADLKTFAALGVHGTSALTCLTAQNPKGVTGIQATNAKLVRQQFDAVVEAFHPSAAKTGMLYSAKLIRTVAEAFASEPALTLVVDPVMVATSGARLLQAPAIRVLKDRLLPRALVTTPNVDEAVLLAEIPIQEVEDLRAAARRIRDRYGCAALVKGGHLKRLEVAVDVFWDGRTELLLQAPFVRGVSTHGTGCTYSAAITAFLSRGLTLTAAVSRAKDYISQAIASSVRAGGHDVLGHLRGREFQNRLLGGCGLASNG